jgi:hypothetical protein
MDRAKMIAYIRDFTKATDDGTFETEDDLKDFVIDSLYEEFGDVSELYDEAMFEQLVIDYDDFEENYDTYGYGDAFSDRDEAREVTRNALLDADFRQQIIDRLQEIADEDDDFTDPALKLIARIKKLG